MSDCLLSRRPYDEEVAARLSETFEARRAHNLSWERELYKKRNARIMGLDDWTLAPPFPGEATPVLEKS